MTNKKMPPIKLVGLELKRIHFEHNDTFLGEGEPKRTNRVELAHLGEQTFSIENRDQVTFGKNEGVKLEIVIRGTFQRYRQWTEERINEELELLATPLRLKSSLVIAFLTDQSLQIPVLVPPVSEDTMPHNPFDDEIDEEEMG